MRGLFTEIKCSILRTCYYGVLLITFFTAQEGESQRTALLNKITNKIVRMPLIKMFCQSATIIIKGSKQLGLNQLLTCLGVRTEPVCYYNNQRIKTAWTESVTYMSWSTYRASLLL